MIKNIKIAVIGGNKATLCCLKTLKKNKYTNFDVFYYVPKKVKNLVEYCNLKKEFNFKSYKYFKFTKIKEIEKKLIKNKYDVLICIGLTQILNQSIINGVKYGCIGAHPTNLPDGRGRSSVAWNILLKRQYRISIFKIDKTIDSGPILTKSKFGSKNLDANEYYFKIYKDIDKLLIHSIKKLILAKKLKDFKKQNKKEFFCLRKFEDGFINFLNKKKEITSLINASSWPHPGAFVCFKNNHYLVSLINDEKNDTKFYAEPGTILLKKDKFKYLVMTSDKPIWLKVKGNFKVGERFLVFNIYKLYILLKKIKNVL